MSEKVYRARVKRLEEAKKPTDLKITVDISPLPDKEERRKIEAADPNTRYVWIDAETIRGQS